MNNKQTALDAYMIRIAAILAKMENMQRLAKDHFGHDPDTIGWSDVGDLGRIEFILDEMTPAE